MSIYKEIERYIRFLQRTIKGNFGMLHSHITEPRGKLPLDNASCTFVVVVGPLFDQRKPDAMMTCRIGYCNAFEALGIPYYIVDINDLIQVLTTLNNPFCLIFGADYKYMNRQTIHLLKRYPKFVWVDPWFKNSNHFFKSHDLDPKNWTWSKQHRNSILNSEPSFVYTATVERGLNFFEEWQNHGVNLISLPLACDTALYNRSVQKQSDFDGIRMAFVGGYWGSKGKQIDRYLKPFEDELVIYGYNKWPYKGYRGKLPREAEASLYRQVLISPSINEPSVKLLHGQINERVFKVLGSGGMTVVDAVPAYRDLFNEEELIIPKDEREFYDIIHEMFNNQRLRLQYAQQGYKAVISRHTYIHRAEKVLKLLNILGANKLFKGILSEINRI